jgi:RNA polymerase sigma factor (sigma-70 family)
LRWRRGGSPDEGIGIEMNDRGQAQSGRTFDADPALVESCLNGDPRAWDELVERYGRLVYSIPRRMGFSATDADDVFQEVFATLLRSLGSVRDRKRLSAWLITTTRRECWRRGRTMARHAELDESLADGTPPVIDEIARWEREQGVREAVRRLDARCRELLTALFLDASSPSYEAIAARLGMPVGSIGPTRARCFKKLEAQLRELGVDVAV